MSRAKWPGRLTKGVVGWAMVLSLVAGVGGAAPSEAAGGGAGEAAIPSGAGAAGAEVGGREGDRAQGRPGRLRELVRGLDVPSTLPAGAPGERASDGARPVHRVGGSDESGPEVSLGELDAVRAETVRAEGAFEAKLFEAPTPAKVIWQTPTPSQTLFLVRPPTTRPAFESARDGTEGAALPAPARLANAKLYWFAFQDPQGETVPGVLAVPAEKTGPFPLVVLTHGLLSHKMQVFGQIGGDLMAEGCAVVAVDLPLHGERAGWGLNLLDTRDLGRMAGLWRQSVVNIRQAVDVAVGSGLVDTTRPVVAAGYSLGCWMSVIAGAADERVGAMALMVGGATELPARLLMNRQFANSDPRVAVAAFSPRPVLLVSGRLDKTVTPAMADRLFDAAREPKEHRWYESGHILREPAYRETAAWIGAAARKPVGPVGDTR